MAQYRKPSPQPDSSDHRPRNIEEPKMICHLCATSGGERPAAARCRFCTVSLCSEHLAQALQPEPSGIGRGCRHVFIAAGWLANAIGRPVSTARLSETPAA